MGDARQELTVQEADRQARWDDAQRLANLGAWVWDPRDKVSTVDRGVHAASRSGVVGGSVLAAITIWPTPWS
jgi:hypothetical protein